ncbi:DUF6207 family protein [Streptomyces sp. NBC_01635]|uniref:DUF6207 family protein n=1 Tax=Streptomyces sp. NBC_01635 TaxID=2975904 RepID=UPI003864212C|nr:DUF6207 family protein [Streptomyces sp. NBC_01635]
MVDAAAADADTALAFRAALAGCWATATATATADRRTKVPGRPGVRQRCCLDLRRAGRLQWSPVLVAKPVHEGARHGGTRSA